MDFKQVFDNAPVPILIYQDGELAYCNAAAFEVFRFLGHDVSPERLAGFQPLGLLDPAELEETTRDIGSVLERGVTFRNIPRTLQDVEGNQVSALVSAGPTAWLGRPAIEVSFVVVGLSPVERLVNGGGGPGRRDSMPDARVGILEELTPRETRVALLLAGGWDTGRIRTELGIRDSTLRGYIKAIYRKLGVHSRSELVRRVIGHR